MSDFLRADSHTHSVHRNYYEIVNTVNRICDYLFFVTSRHCFIQKQIFDQQ